MNRRDWSKKALIAVLGGLMFSHVESGATSKEKSKILFVGDSITQHGCFIRYLRRMLTENDLADKYELINGGLSGETITGLTESTHPGPRPYLFDRLDSLLEQHDPDVAFFCYGINCGIYQPMTESKLIKYQAGLDRILQSCKSKRIKKVVLMTPPPLALKETKKKEILANPPEDWTWKQPYPEYSSEVVVVFGEAVKSRESKKTQVIDLYQPLLNMAADAYGNDPIHPNDLGHKLIANLIWDHYQF